MAERRRSWNWRDRTDTDPTPDGDDQMVVAETEMIVGLSLEQNYRLGEQAGEVWASVPDQTPSPDTDPGAEHVQQQGRQSTLLTIGRCAPEVEATRATERKAFDGVSHAELELWDAVVEEHGAKGEVDEQEQRAKAINLSLVEDAPSWIFGVLIGVIVIGEWVLNRVPLEVAGDNRLETNLLAAALAVGLVAAAHLGGVGIKRALVRANGDDRPAAHHLVMCGALVALALAAISMSGVRVAYFDSPLHATDSNPPWLWLLLLQVFLLTVATLLSMAHDTPMWAELSRLQDLLDDALARVDTAKASLKRARAAHVDARFELRSVTVKALTDVHVQAAHTARGFAEFSAGFQAALGSPVPFVQPNGGSLLAIVAWEAWLDEADGEGNSEGVDDLVRRWRAELDGSAPRDEVTARHGIDAEAAWQTVPPESPNGSRPHADAGNEGDGR